MTAARVWRVSGFALALLFAAVAQGAGFTPILPLDRPTILDYSQAFPGRAFEPAHLLDGDPRTEYASAGKGVGTQVDFDFGRPVAVAGFEHVDRNDPATVRAAKLIFSRDRDFHTTLSSVAVKHADRRAGLTRATFPAVTARYVRWEVTAINAAGNRCVGGAEIAFFSPAPPDALPVRDSLSLHPQQLVEPGNGRAVQPVSITVEHRYAEPVEAALVVDGLPPIPWKLHSGAQTREVALPAVQAASPLRAVLTVNGREVARKEIVRQPVRPWTIYLLPHSHNDIGYTALQTDVEQKQISNLKAAMRLARQTANYPEGAGFKWNVEVMWPVDCYLRQATAEERQNLVEAIRKGQVGLEGLYGNMLTGLSRPEEQMRTLDCGLAVARRCGVTLRSAMISDVPGYTWGTAVAMAEAGVKYFSFGPNYFGRRGNTMAVWQDKPFYWETPDGRHRVLCWCPRMGYALGHVVGAGEKLAGFLPGYLADRAKEGYPYDITYLRWNVNGDNGAPDEKLSDVVKKWNAEHLAPKLVIALTATAFAEFERRYGPQLPVFRGDYTPYWEDGAASSALETALVRASAERLVQAETLSTLLCPERFRWPAFERAWRNVLLYNEHTWGAYDSIRDPDRPFVRQQWRIKHSFAVDADRQSRELLAALVPSLGLNAAAPAASVIVYNTNSWPRTDLVVLPRELKLAGNRVEDADGRAVPSQRLSGGDLAFLASDVPPLAGQRFFLTAGACPAKTHLAVHGATLTGADLTVQLDPGTGAIKSLRSRRLGVELVDGRAATAVNDYFYLPGGDLKDLKRNGPVTISVKESGPLVASLVVEGRAPGCQHLRREVRLIEGLDRVDLIDGVDKKPVRAKEGVHFGFGFAVPDARVHLDVGWAAIRPNRDQIPASCREWFPVQRYVDVSNSRYGITWAAPDAPMVEIGRITGTKCGTPADPDGMYPDPKSWMAQALESPTLYSFVMNNHWSTNYCADQQGLVEFRYSIAPHGPYCPLSALRFGIERSQPLLARVEAPVAQRPTRASRSEAGSRALADEPPVAPARLTVSPAEVILTSLRPSRDGKAIMLRLFGPTDRAIKATVRFAPPEPKAIWISDLTEQPRAAAGAIIDVPAQGVVTLRAEQFADHRGPGNGVVQPCTTTVTR